MAGNEFGSGSLCHSVAYATSNTIAGMSDERNHPVWPWITLTTVLILVTSAYVAAYVYMARPPRYLQLSGVGPFEIIPDYKGERQNRDQKFWEKIFRPAHWLDRRIRPDRWVVE